MTFSIEALPALWHWALHVHILICVKKCLKASRTIGL